MPDRFLSFISNETLLRILFILLVAFTVRWLLLWFIHKGVELLQKLDIKHKDEIAGRARTLGQIGASLVTILITVTASILILNILKFDVTAILAGAGILGIVIGFATQALLKDIIAGISLLAEDQYHVGDILAINGVKGEVIKMGLRATIIRDFGDVVHVISNSQIQEVSIIPYGIAKAEVVLRYSEGIEKLEKIFVVELKSFKSSLFLEPPKFFGIDEFRETGMKVSVGGKTAVKNQAAAAGELRRWLKGVLEKEGIQAVEMRYPL